MSSIAVRLWNALPRPLDPVRSIKLKLGILLVASGGVAFGFFRWQIGWLPPRTSFIALWLALLTSQVLAHGMTRPLREMTAAAQAMARGDYTRRVRATSRDEVGQLAVAFNQMSADLAAADRQRRELIANVSHELRTPISALRAVLENLVDGVTSPDPATLRTALAQSERLSSLVTDLLDLSRIDAGALTLRRETFALSGLLDEVMAEAEVNAAAAGRPVRMSAEVKPPDAVAFADRARLHQVLVALLDNAVTHGPPDGRVQVLARDADDHLVIEVRDEGPGISRDERHLVFQRFARGERASGGGTGLGLAIARWVVDLHGGTIAAVDPGAVHSGRNGSGCRIRLTLPAA
jgi:signal transduction histidine kinase